MSERLPNKVTVDHPRVGPEPAGFIDPNPFIRRFSLPSTFLRREKPPVRCIQGPHHRGSRRYVAFDRSWSTIRAPSRRAWPCKVFTVQMTKGKTYTIRNESNVFDAFLS